MGCYINSQNESKEDFLRRYGTPISHGGIIENTVSMVPVCLVDNGFFTAAVVVFSQSEFNAMNDPNDHRPKMWYMVPREEVRKVSDLAFFERAGRYERGV